MYVCLPPRRAVCLLCEKATWGRTAWLVFERLRGTHWTPPPLPKEEGLLSAFLDVQLLTPLPERSLRSRVSSFLVWSASASLSITLLKGRPLSLKLSLVLSSRQKPPLPASVCVRSGVTRTAVSSVTCDTMALTGVCSSLSLCCPLSGSSSFLEETIFNLPLVAGNYFRLRGPKISVTRTRLCHCSVEATGARTSALCMDTGMRISETFHISWNIVLVVIFPTI